MLQGAQLPQQPQFRAPVAGQPPRPTSGAVSTVAPGAGVQHSAQPSAQPTGHPQYGIPPSTLTARSVAWTADGEQFRVREVVASVVLSPPPSRLLLSGQSSSSVTVNWGDALRIHFGVAASSTSYHGEASSARVVCFGDRCTALYLASGRVIVTGSEIPECIVRNALIKAYSLAVCVAGGARPAFTAGGEKLDSLVVSVAPPSCALYDRTLARRICLSVTCGVLVGHRSA